MLHSIIYSNSLGSWVIKVFALVFLASTRISLYTILGEDIRYEYQDFHIMHYHVFVFTFTYDNWNIICEPVIDWKCCVDYYRIRYVLIGAYFYASFEVSLFVAGEQTAFLCKCYQKCCVLNTAFFWWKYPWHRYKLIILCIDRRERKS